MHIRTVLCPVDFSGLDPLEVGVASEVCRAFGATLLLHHNLAAAHPGFARAWEWARAHEGHEPDIPNAEHRLQALAASVPAGVRVEAAITSGPVAQVVVSMATELDVDLIVLGSHGWSTPEHASVTERLLREAPCPVLTFQEGGPRLAAFRLSAASDDPIPVLVPTDLTRDSLVSVAYACALARLLPLRLDLLHVASRDLDDAALDRTLASLDTHVPGDLIDRVAAHVCIGPAPETIVEYADETGPALIVLGEHAHAPVRRLLTRDTTRAVMHAVRCPVWAVPPQVRM